MRTTTRIVELKWSLAAAFTVVAVFVLSNAPTPLYAKWQQEWGFSSSTLTVVFAAYMVGLIGTLVVAGRIADLKGRRVVLLPALVAAVASGALFLAAQDAAWLLVARVLAGVAVGGAVTAGMAAVVDLAPKRHREIGGLVASVSMVLGAGLGPMVSGVSAQATRSAQAWTFATVTALAVIALVVGARLPLTRPEPAASPTRVRPRRPRPPRDRRRELAWGAAAFAPGITATSFVLSLGPSVLASVLGVVSPLMAGAIACAMFLVATGVQFLAKRFSIRAHLALSSIAAFASMALLAATMTVAPHWAVLLASALLGGVAQGLGQLAGLTLIATRILPENRAESNAALNVAGYVPAGLLPVATGYLADGIGLEAATVVFATTVGIFALIALPAVGASARHHLVTTERAPDSAQDQREVSTLVIIAHPELEASRVNALWRRALDEDGRATVRALSDTRSADGFDPAAEQDALAAHDRIVLQFPFRWYSAPPLLAEWLEAAFSRGWAYGPGGHALEGKELSIAVSTWSRASDYAKDGKYGRTMQDLTSPFATTAARVGMRYREGWFLHGVGELSDAELEQSARDYAVWASKPVP
ncbi:MFS transporter [Streptomyces sp. NPDC057496]|uniref:MFS transporter n=1 Tax=Streptomyces sp. NPDC057496 TaxID=3346149 RepID=UPI0036CBAA7B